MKPRVIPNKHMCHKHGMQLMCGVSAGKVNKHHGVTTPMVAIVNLQCGDQRVYGVEKAYINSSLEMVVSGGFVNDRNELVKPWRIPIELEAKDG